MTKKINIKLFDSYGKIKPNTVSIKDFIKLTSAIDGIFSQLLNQDNHDITDHISIINILDKSLGIEIAVPDNKYCETATNSLMEGLQSGFDEKYSPYAKDIASLLKKSGGNLQVSTEESTSRIISSVDPIKIVKAIEEKIEGYYITGELIRIGGSDKNDISVEIKDPVSKDTIICKIKNTDLAMQLAQHLYKKIGCYGVATLHNDKIRQFTIEEFYVKEDLDSRGLFYGISKVINDSSVKNLLEQDDLSLYFKKLRDND